MLAAHRPCGPYARRAREPRDACADSTWRLGVWACPRRLSRNRRQLLTEISVVFHELARRAAWPGRCTGSCQPTKESRMLSRVWMMCSALLLAACVVGNSADEPPG